jgi:hypothetical protein
MTDIADAEVVGTDLDVRVATTPAPAGLFNTDDPALVLKKATKVANVLKDMVDKQGMAVNISGRPYIKVDAWAALGNILGVYPKTEYTRELTSGDLTSLGWEAAVVVVNSFGVTIGRAEAQCLRAERNWKSRDDFALRSMAQTRAMGKALRMPLGWIAVLAGFEATPAEEMPAEPDDVPFEETGPVQGPREDQANRGDAGTDGASTEWAAESDVTDVLELAARVGEEEHTKTVNAIAKHRA